MHLKYISSTRIFSSRFTKIFLLFCACAFIGSSIGKIVSHNTARQTAASAQSSNWGLSFQEEGKRPVGNATIEELAQYNAFFAEDTEEKKIYLTFDAGFENGNTPEMCIRDSFQGESLVKLSRGKITILDLKRLETLQRS